MENPVVIDQGSHGAAEELHPPSGRWKDVHDLAYSALTTQTKDIELLAWLSESSIRVYGIEALDAVLEATAALITSNFETLHSADDETMEDRVAPLAGLNGSLDSDGTLIRPLRLNSLSPANIYGRLNLWDFDKAKKNNNSAMLAQFQQEFSNLDGALYVRRNQAIDRAIANINRIDASLTQAAGADSPSFGRIREVLDDIARAYRELGTYVQLPHVPVAEPVGQPDGEPSPIRAAGPTQAAPGQIMDREQAFRALLEVAAFFKRTEPHSTIPMALETLVRRGRMDFVALLAELLPDENQRRDMLTRAGIKFDQT